MLNNELRNVIEEFSGTLGFAASDIATGRDLHYLSEHRFPTASAIKIIVMVEAFQQSHAGKLNLAQRVPVEKDDVVGGSGVLATLSTEPELPIIDYVELMMTISDNTATNVMIRLLGLDAINKTARSLGMHHTTLHGPVTFEKVDGEFTTLGTSTPEDCLLLLEQLARGDVVDANSSQQMIDIMKRQQYLTALPRYLPYNPFADALETNSTLWVADKPGMMPGIRSDVGLIGDDQGVIALALFSEGCRDHSFSVDNEGNISLARIAHLVYEALRN